MTWMRKRDHNLFTNAVSLLVCGVLAGVVVAAAVFPAVAMGALAAKAGADSFAELPTELEVPSPPEISYLYARDDRTLIGTFYDENRHNIPLSEIPQVMRDAIVAAEDGRFYEHKGVDIKGVARAYLANEFGSGETDQGASTLTMQYVRQALTYGATNPEDVLAATETTPERKIREIRMAIELEKRLTKDQILQNYLNIASFGNGAYGVHAAASVYFNKEPKDLTLAEAALLAGLPKAPSSYDPSTEEGYPQALERRTYVLNQMVELGMISRHQADLADDSPLEVTGTRTPRDCTGTLVNHWGFFCDFFYRWWLEQDDFGVDELARASKLKSGGYRITSTLDVAVQESAKNNVEQQLGTGHSDALLLAAIEPGKGYVRAMAANRNFSLDDSANGESTDRAKRNAGIRGTYPNTTNQLLAGGGDVVGYKGGSTFKLFTALAALENGYPLDFTIHARSPYVSPVYPAAPEDAARCGTRWCPRNASASMNGPRNMWTGFGFSVNTYFIPLQEKVGAEKVVEMAERLGIKFRSSADQAQRNNNGGHLWGPFTIGVSDTVPLELANAYATVAAEGVYCEPMPVEKLVDVHGEAVTEPVAPRCKQAVSVEIARAAADIARCPIRAGGGLGRCGGVSTAIFNTAQIVGHPTIGKTGTSDNNWTANFVISTKHLTIATVVADPDNPHTPHFGNGAATAAQNSANFVMRDAMVGLPQIDFTPPPNNLAFGVKVPIPDVRCKSRQEAESTIKRAGFDVYVDESKKVDSPCPPNTVATTEPTGSTSKGSTVSLLISGGPGDEPPPPPTDDGDNDGGGGGNGGIVVPPPPD